MNSDSIMKSYINMKIEVALTLQFRLRGACPSRSPKQQQNRRSNDTI
jgi:hypothetical protein